MTETAPDDVLVERDGARVVVDPVSLGFVAGAELDFVDDLIGAQFKLNNPNVTASCGCGTSFSVYLSLFTVMAGLVPAIHAFGATAEETWMPGTRPGMTKSCVVEVC